MQDNQKTHAQLLAEIQALRTRMAELEARVPQPAITSTEAANEAIELLRQNKGLLALILNALPVGVWILDAEGTIHYGNPEAMRIWNGARYVGPQEFGVYQAWWHDTGEPIPPEEWAAARAIKSGETSLNEVIDIACFDGSRKTIVNSALPIRNDEDRIVAAIIVNKDMTELHRVQNELKRTNRDLDRRVMERTAALHASNENLRQEVSERRETEAALRESERKFSRIFHLNPLAMSITRLEDGLFLDVNEGYCRLLGYGREEMLNYTAGHDLQLWPDPAERDTLVQQVREKGEVADFEARMRYRDGSIKDCSLSVRRIEIGGEDGMIAIIRDITELNALEDALIQARITAEETSRAKSEFLANISHEIRTPMTVFMGMLDLALATNLDPTQREYLSTAQTASQSLLRLMEDILDFSRIETGHLALRQSEVVLPDLVHEVIDLFRHKASQKGVALKITVDPQAPAVIHGDEQRLRQILINLIDNAIKFTDQGCVTLEVSPGERDQVRIAVTDTGIGIAEQKIGQLFCIFSQVDSSSTRRYGGTGLGLALCRRLVEMMGGTIDVESRFGEGSRFYLDVPERLKGVPHQKPSRKQPAVVSDQPRRRESSREVILLVEDDPMIQHVMKTMLEKKGWQVVTANDGEAALNILESAHFDMIFMDVQMPRLDGLKTSRRIRAKEKPGEHVPIVALTAHSLAEDRRECLRAGMDAYLTKPVEPGVLYATVEECLATRRKPLESPPRS